MRTIIEHTTGDASRNLNRMREEIDLGQNKDEAELTKAGDFDFLTLKSENGKSELTFICLENAAFPVIGSRWLFIPFGFKSEKREINPVKTNSRGVTEVTNGAEFKDLYTMANSYAEKLYL